MKKVALFLLTLLLPLMVSAAYRTFQVDGIFYEQRDASDEFVNVTSTPEGIAKYAGDVVIPASVTFNGKTYPVKKIGQWAFWECTGLKTIVLPEGLEEIENSSFYGCTQLKAVTFPSTLKSLRGVEFSREKGAFEGCAGLKSVYFPASMITDELWTANIGWASFRDCTGLKTIFVAGSKTAIAMYDVFSGCTGVTDFVSYIENPESGYVDARDFEGFAQTASLIVPDNKKEAYLNAREWYTFQHIFERSSYSKAFAVLTAGLGGKLTYSNEDIERGTQVYGVQKGQSISVTITPDEDHKLLRLLMDGQDVTNGVNDGKYTVSNIQKDFTLEAVFEEGGYTPPVGEDESYVVYDNGTLTFYFDNQRSSRQGTTYDLNKTAETPKWLEFRSMIDKVDFDESFAVARPETMYEWFYNCTNLKEIQNIENLNTIEVKDFCQTFYGCTSLTNIDLSHFNTSNAWDFEQMFLRCSSLTSLDLSHFNTENVTCMDRMFSDCTNLKQIDLSSFNTSKVREMSSMFRNCSSLTSIDLRHFKSDKMYTMGGMFYGCSSLTSIDLSSFDTSYAMSGPYTNYSNLSSIFSGCSSLTTLTFSGKFVTSDEQYLEKVFIDCINLKKVSYTDDIPVSIHSKFFEGVGTAESPATLDVPEQYSANYKAKFDGNMFFGGYFLLSGEENEPQLEVTFKMNDVDGVVYDEKFNVRVTAKNVGPYTFDGDLFAYYSRQTEDGSWSGQTGLSISQTIRPEMTGSCGYSMAPVGKQPGHYKYEYGYITPSGQKVTVGNVEFDYLPDDRYVTIVSFDKNDMITYCNENDLDFSNVSGLKAYTAGGFNTATNEVMMMHVTDVPAQTGVLLIGDFSRSYLVPKHTSSTIYVNMLMGVLESQYVKRNTDEGYTNYVFKDGSKGLAFYLANQGIGSYVWENEAYLQIPTQAAASREIITLKFDDTNSIADVETGSQPFDVYTLGGLIVKRGATSLEQLPKGIYIVNGRKVVKK